MSRKLFLFLAISIGWAALVGVVLLVARIPLDSLPGVLIMALLYMPSPLVAAVIVERGWRRERFALPRGGARRAAAFLLAPIAVVVAFVVLYLVAIWIGGSVLGIPAFGRLALTEDALVDAAARLLGDEAVAAAGPPPPVIVLLLASLWGAMLAGWTLNGVLAMGEEYGWRGLMWDELEQHGPVRANVTIGFWWGLWHAPVIVQGYNYAEPLLGVPAMIVFCIGFSFALSALRERFASVLPVAAAHGMFNAIAMLLILLAPGTWPVLTGPLGLLGSLVLLGVGVALWIRRPSRGAGVREHAEHGIVNG